MNDRTRGLLDTSVVVDHDSVDAELLPDESAIAAVTLAELAAGPHAAADRQERARRQDRLRWAAATWDPLPFDAEAARAYGRVFAAAQAAGRSSRRRLADLLIAATAASNGLPLYTSKPVRLLRFGGACKSGRCLNDRPRLPRRSGLISPEFQTPL